MKKTMSALILASAALLAAAPASAVDLDFSLVNKTGYTISEVYVASSASDEWDEDILGRDLLENGDSVDISFEKGSKGCKWDLKVTYEDEEEATWNGFDLCSISSVVLRYDRKKGTTWAEKR